MPKIKTHSGAKKRFKTTKNEQNGYRDISIFKDGVIM